MCALQVTAAEAAKAFALEWRMEATAHIASLMVRDQQCKVSEAAVGPAIAAQCGQMQLG